jgi:hypothetical protein
MMRGLEGASIFWSGSDPKRGATFLYSTAIFVAGRLVLHPTTNFKLSSS